MAESASSTTSTARRCPLYLLTLFGKHERANLSKAERNELSKLVQGLGAWIKR